MNDGAGSTTLGISAQASGGDSVSRPGAPRSDKLTGIEAGRGVAALLVLGIHARDHLFKNFSVPIPVGDLFVFGHAGVDFFFVLSGFIILYVHRRDLGQPHRLGHYLQRRFTRIYPFYWTVLALALLALALSVHHKPLPPASEVIASALLLPSAQSTLVPVAWTLQHEIVFYVTFSLIILNRRLGAVALCLWLGMILRSLGAEDGPVLGAFNLEFFFGMTAAALLARFTVPLPRAVLLLGALIFFAVGGAEDLGLVKGLSLSTHLGYAIGSMLAILGIVEAERQEKLSVPSALMAVGGASYAIYLTHMLGIGTVWIALRVLRLDRVLPLGADFVVLCAGGVAIGLIISHLVEQPLIQMTRRLIALGTTGPAARIVRAAGRGLV
jgi:exopolysaccharide production protein ExoZ